MPLALTWTTQPQPILWKTVNPRLQHVHPQRIKALNTASLALRTLAEVLPPPAPARGRSSPRSAEGARNDAATRQTLEQVWCQYPCFHPPEVFARSPSERRSARRPPPARPPQAAADGQRRDVQSRGAGQERLFLLTSVAAAAPI